MATWAQAMKDQSNPWEKLNSAAPGTAGHMMPGQRALTPEEKAKYREDMQKFKDFHGDAISEQTGGRKTAVSDEMVSAGRIGQAYDEQLWGEDAKKEYLEAAAKQPLGNTEDPAERLKVLSFLTQDVAPNEEGRENVMGESTCAGATVVGAAFLAEGGPGLAKVISAIEKADDGDMRVTSEKYSSPEYKQLKEKLAKDPSGKSLTVADLQALQQTTTEVLQASEPPEWRNEPGIVNKTMDDFLARSPELAGVIEQSGMQIEMIDNDGVPIDGERKPDHYVLRIKGAEPGQDMIYDPSARRGGQIIDFEEGVKHYDKARWDTIGDSEHPYAR
jgi:hypothetical protein